MLVPAISGKGNDRFAFYICGITGIKNCYVFGKIRAFVHNPGPTAGAADLDDGAGHEDLACIKFSAGHRVSNGQEQCLHGGLLQHDDACPGSNSVREIGHRLRWNLLQIKIQ